MMLLIPSTNSAHYGNRKIEGNMIALRKMTSCFKTPKGNASVRSLILHSCSRRGRGEGGR